MLPPPLTLEISETSKAGIISHHREVSPSQIALEEFHSGHHCQQFLVGGAIPLLTGMKQVYSRLSTTHGHITNCKLDSVVYAGASVGVPVFMGLTSTPSREM